jgi:hypothetical protein
MTDAPLQQSAWQQGYEAALRDLERHAARLQERGEAASLTGVLAELRAGLTAAEAGGIPPEELEREWTAG